MDWCLLMQNVTKTAVEPYCADITETDLKVLQERMEGGRKSQACLNSDIVGSTTDLSSH